MKTSLSVTGGAKGKTKGKSRTDFPFSTSTLWHGETSHDGPPMMFGSGSKNFLGTIRKWKTHDSKQKNSFVVGQDTRICSQMISHRKKPLCSCPAPSGSRHSGSSLAM